MRDSHPAFSPTSLFSMPCSTRLIRLPVVKGCSLLHYIIRGCGKVISGSMGTIHTNVKYAYDDHSDHPHHLTIPAVAHTDLFASVPNGCVIVLRYRKVPGPYLKFWQH